VCVCARARIYIYEMLRFYVYCVDREYDIFSSHTAGLSVALVNDSL
jgi:hypothetical protein